MKSFKKQGRFIKETKALKIDEYITCSETISKTKKSEFGLFLKSNGTFQTSYTNMDIILEKNTPVMGSL